MKYLCLICAEPAYMMEFLEPRAAEDHFAEYQVFTDELRRDDRFVGANRLTPPETAKTLRVRDGKVAVTDGPYAETKEQLGGYYLIEAGSIDEAVQIAAKIPGARYGCVEVRPIAEDAATVKLLAPPLLR